jgi:DNA-binding Lrp family transcriptional regulator
MQSVLSAQSPPMASLWHSINPQVLKKMRGIVTLHGTDDNWDLIAETRVQTLADYDAVLCDVRMIDRVLKQRTCLLFGSQ